MLALRIITQSESDCYAVLGIIHNQWRPVPGRIKDFIAIPRNNFYKSLHTTVISEKGHAFEVQIRTEEMHKMAEEGIAAHWKYKDGPVSARDEQRLAWLRQVVEWQRDMKSSDEFLSTLKIDLYPEEVYTFTPKGKIVILPQDATPIDFAYTVHTEVGHTCVGAKVNGRMAPLRYKLRSGDIVEIQTSAGPSSQPRLAATGEVAARPPEDQALAERASARARHRNRPQADRKRSAQISHCAEEPERSRADARGQRKRPGQARRPAGRHRLRQVFGAQHSGARASRRCLVWRVRRTANPTKTRREDSPASSAASSAATTSAIMVKGHDDLLVYRARCCNPIRGEEIVGYVTRGKGVAVHSKSCPNVTNLMYEPDRRIAVEWGKDCGRVQPGQSGYPVKLAVLCDNRPGMLKQIATVISDANTNIRNIEAKTAEDHATVDLVADIADLKHLERIVTGVRKIPGVRDVQRMQKIVKAALRYSLFAMALQLSLSARNHTSVILGSANRAFNSDSSFSDMGPDPTRRGCNSFVVSIQ